MSLGLASAEVKALVVGWFRRLTDHAPVEEMLAMLDLQRLQMTFPEATLRSEADFRKWYGDVTGKFFDQRHDLEMLDVDVQEHRAHVNLVVGWQARTWTPPAAYSGWIGAHAYQEWMVERAAEHLPPRIVTYTVARLEPMQRP
jgi:hypothetical protein